MDNILKKKPYNVISSVTNPTLTAFIPPKQLRNGIAVIICPGGGYHSLAVYHEGSDVAIALNKVGITAFVLKYRLPNNNGLEDAMFAPICDAQQAILSVRERANDYSIDGSKVGILGFSAGGHVAACTSVHYDNPKVKVLGHANLRPDFTVLAYPVISFKDEICHNGSRNNLLGNSRNDLRWIHYFSTEMHITPNTPPTFLMHSTDDKTVNVANSLVYYDALLANGISAEMHIYEKGGHGYGLENPTTKQQWLDLCVNWILAKNKISI